MKFGVISCLAFTKEVRFSSTRIPRAAAFFRHLLRAPVRKDKSFFSMQFLVMLILDLSAFQYTEIGQRLRFVGTCPRAFCNR